MAIPNAAIDLIRRIGSPPDAYRAPDAAPSFITIELQSGISFRLDMNDRRAPIWLSVISELWQSDEPVFLEADPITNTINRLLVPKVFTVDEIADQARGDRLDVVLEISNAKHHLRVSNPDYQQLVTALDTARRQGTAVLVTESRDEHEIIDVRPVPLPFATGPVASPVGSHRLLWSSPVVTLAQAQYYFDLVSGQSCLPAAPSSTCIPFLYPDDGCCARAHEMCRLMMAAGAQPRKVWNRGDLIVETRNNPDCYVCWDYHVAPTLLVDSGSSLETRVIDPSLFAAPVSQASWVAKQQDRGAVLQDSDASVYYINSHGNLSYDPDYSATKQDLASYQRELKLRTADLGPPPYRGCP